MSNYVGIMIWMAIALLPISLCMAISEARKDICQEIKQLRAALEEMRSK